MPAQAMTTPRERAIGFTGELLTAIRAGRKTETRRPMRPQPTGDAWPASPFVAGDRLWVREPYRRVGDGYVYARADVPTGERLTPARFMPRAAARVFLRVIDVRGERLSAIAEADAIAEGFAPMDADASGRARFLAAWDTFYADAGLSAADDPMVWVIRFALLN